MFKECKYGPACLRRQSETMSHSAKVTSKSCLATMSSGSLSGNVLGRPSETCPSDTIPETKLCFHSEQLQVHPAAAPPLFTLHGMFFGLLCYISLRFQASHLGWQGPNSHALANWRIYICTTDEKMYRSQHSSDTVGLRKLALHCKRL